MVLITPWRLAHFTMPRIAIVDTNYPGYLASLPPPVNGDYETELRQHLSRAFGTADFYSHYLAQEGWTCLDIVGNYSALQKRWAQEHSFGDARDQAIALQQISEFRPDVVLMQDLSFFDAATLSMLRKKYVLCGQCSCPFPRVENVQTFQILWTSFPHYVSKFEALGVQAHYLPLAFDPRMLSEESPKKQFDISFVGGVGRNSHWRAGTDVLEAVAKAFPDQCHFYIYGRENLAKDSPLHGVSGPPVWGREMYSVYGRSKIVINRHGEVAEGYTNNLRCYEAQGVGALMITEHSKNNSDLFPHAPTYRDADDLIGMLKSFLKFEDSRAQLAKRGQFHVLAHHTYAHRMKVVSEVLTHALEKVVA